MVPSSPSSFAAGAPARNRRRPPIGIESVVLGGRRVAVRENPVFAAPFCRLLHFERDARPAGPPLLVVTPLSGHFTALLRDMLVALMPEHDLYVTDWADARDVPAEAGEFGIDDNIAAVMDSIRRIGAGVHVIGLCQSAMPALAAVALLSAAGEGVPASLTLFGGMIDTRIRPTRIDRFAAARSPLWFERNVIAPVPPPYAGRGRRVYPASLQQAALIAYLMRHLATGRELLFKLMHDDGEDAAHHPFLTLYLSVMDLPAGLFLDTIRLVFREAALPRGRLAWRGIAVDPSAITRTALMTVEGEDDDVSAPGQTRIAQDLCRNVPKRAHHSQPGIGHFGMFHGRAWRHDIMPRLAAFIRDAR